MFVLREPQIESYSRETARPRARRRPRPASSDYAATSTWKSAYPRFSGGSSGRRFYSPEVGRWINRDPIGERGGNELYVFCGNSPLVHFDILGKIIQSEDCIDPWLDLYVESYTKTLTTSWEYKAAGASLSGAGPVKAMIVQRMLNSSHRFMVDPDPASAQNAEEHVQLRAEIVRKAKTATAGWTLPSEPGGFGCAFAALSVYTLAGALPGKIYGRLEETYDALVPGDWGYIMNRKAYPPVNTESSGTFAGEHVIYLGIPDDVFYGHPYKFKALAGWLDYMSSDAWGEDSPHGDPALSFPDVFPPGVVEFPGGTTFLTIYNSGVLYPKRGMLQ